MLTRSQAASPSYFSNSSADSLLNDHLEDSLLEEVKTVYVFASSPQKQLDSNKSNDHLTKSCDFRNNRTSFD